MKAIRCITYFLAGAFLLSAFSTLQKVLAGLPVHYSGYYIPVLFGGIVGVFLGILYQRVRRQRNNLLVINWELQKAKEKAEENEKLKSAFLANVSHELLTPLNGILGFSNLLKLRTIEEEKRAKYVSLICRSGNRMHNTVKELVEISKIDAGQVSIKKEKNNIKEQASFLFNFFNEEVQKKGLTLVFNKGKHYSDTFIADKEKICTILLNLVKNSIKYTDSGHIMFTCESTGNEIFYEIKDTGIGIPKERQKAIFERFVQADIEDKDAREGFGLGLSIVKAYVELLGGTMKFESEEGKGTVFQIRIPIEHEK